MIYISHRGNTHGSKLEFENSPEYIDIAINQGFDVEIDVWANQNGIFLGHDGPQYQIKLSWLQERFTKLWIHTKNSLALEICKNNNLHCFFHNTDDYTMTSLGYLWAFPGKQIVSNKCIIVMPELYLDLTKKHVDKHIGVCSDYIKEYKEINNVNI